MELLGLRFVDLRSSQRHESMEFDEQRRDIDRRLRVWMLGVLSPDPTLASLSKQHNRGMEGPGTSQIFSLTKLIQDEFNVRKNFKWNQSRPGVVLSRGVG